MKSFAESIKPGHLHILSRFLKYCSPESNIDPSILKARIYICMYYDSVEKLLHGHFKLMYSSDPSLNAKRTFDVWIILMSK